MEVGKCLRCPNILINSEVCSCHSKGMNEILYLFTETKYHILFLFYYLFLFSLALVTRILIWKDILVIYRTSIQTEQKSYHRCLVRYTFKTSYEVFLVAMKFTAVILLTICRILIIIVRFFINLINMQVQGATSTLVVPIPDAGLLHTWQFSH